MYRLFWIVDSEFNLFYLKKLKSLLQVAAAAKCILEKNGHRVAKILSDWHRSWRPCQNLFLARLFATPAKTQTAVEIHA